MRRERGYGCTLLISTLVSCLSHFCAAGHSQDTRFLREDVTDERLDELEKATHSGDSSSPRNSQRIGAIAR